MQHEGHVEHERLERGELAVGTEHVQEVLGGRVVRLRPVDDEALAVELVEVRLVGVDGEHRELRNQVQALAKHVARARVLGLRIEHVEAEHPAHERVHDVSAGHAQDSVVDEPAGQLAHVCEVVGELVELGLVGKYAEQKQVGGLFESGLALGHEAVHQLVPAPGQLLYRGIEIDDLVERLRGRAASPDSRRPPTCCSSACFPTSASSTSSRTYLADMRKLPRSFIHDGILRMPSRDIMNAMMRGVLGLYTLDPQADDTSTRNVLRQSLHLIAKFPMLAVYAYQAYLDEFHGKSLVIHRPEPRLLDRRELPAHAAPRQQVHRARGARARHDARAARRARRRQQLVVHHARRLVDRHRHLLGDRGVARLAQGPSAWRREPQGRRRCSTTCARPSPTGRTTSRSPTTCTACSTRRRSTSAGLVYGMGHPVYSVSDPRDDHPARLRRAARRREGLLRGVRAARSASSASRRSSSRRSAGSTKASAPTSTSTRASSIGCSTSPPSSTRRCSRSRASWAGARTGSRSSADGGKIIRPAYKSVSPPQDYVPLAER